MENIHPLVKEIIITNAQIVERSRQLAIKISEFYKQDLNLNQNSLLCVGLLKGCIPFMAEFIKHLEIECETQYMLVSSFFGGTKASGTPQIILDIPVVVVNRDILIVEDIIDSGLTLKMIKEYLLLKGASSVRVVTLLDKKQGRKVELDADWSGFDVPKAFLIGFGLDFEEKLRNLPYVAIADSEKIKKWKW